VVWERDTPDRRRRRHAVTRPKGRALTKSPPSSILRCTAAPQGIANHAATGTLYVANAGDGSLRLFQASDFAPLGSIALGADADNIRLDPWRNRIIVGYGKDGLAVIDPASRRKIADMPLDGHPESFQFDETGLRIYVNVPDAPRLWPLTPSRDEKYRSSKAQGRVPTLRWPSTPTSSA
jgi:DNA-binding beta-propeller fold protein YncE